jgi:hypothetical protein
MSDQKRNPAQDLEMEELKKSHEKTLEGLNLQNEGYKCFSCGGRVVFNFTMKFIKEKGLCPDCFWREDEKE